MKISILLPTRHNPENAVRTVRSHLDTISPDNQIEVLVAVDNDDISRFQLIEALQGDPLVKIHEVPRMGYYRLHEYYNLLTRESTGQMLWITSDKTMVRSQNWDKYLEPYLGKFFLCGQRTNWIHEDKGTMSRLDVLFPIIPRFWFDLFGKICDQPSIDSSLYDVVMHMEAFDKTFPKKIIVLLEEIKMDHDRTKYTGIPKIGEPSYHSENAVNLRIQDAAFLYNYLMRHPELLP
jgi:hypothetical protein